MCQVKLEHDGVKMFIVDGCRCDALSRAFKCVDDWFASRSTVCVSANGDCAERNGESMELDWVRAFKQIDGGRIVSAGSSVGTDAEQLPLQGVEQVPGRSDTDRSDSTSTKSSYSGVDDACISAHVRCVNDGVSGDGTDSGAIRTGGAVTNDNIAVTGPNLERNRIWRQERKERKKRKQQQFGSRQGVHCDGWRRDNWRERKSGSVSEVTSVASGALVETEQEKELRATWIERRIVENKVAIIAGREKAQRSLADSEQKRLRAQLQTLQLQEQIDTVRNRDLAAVRKRDQIRIMRETELGKVAVEKAFSYLSGTDNTSGVGSARTVASGGSGSISPNSSVSLQELNNVKEENSRLQDRLNEYVEKHGEIFVECVEKAPTTCFTEDSKGCFPKRALALGYQRKHFARPNGSYRFRKIAPSRYYPPAQA